MSRSNFFFKIITALILLALLSYMGFYVYDSATNPFKTALAVKYTATHGYPVTGICIRAEKTLTESGTLLEIIPGEGERVPAGGLLAVRFGSQELLHEADEMRTLKAQIEQMEEVLGFSEAGMQLVAIDTIARELAIDLQTALVSHDLSSVSQLSAEFKTLTYYSDDGSGLNAAERKLAELRNRLYTLEQNSQSGSTNIYADESGLYSSFVDGLEYLSPEGVSELSVGQVRSLIASEPETGGSGIGKLVTGMRWYYTVLMAKEEAGLLIGGQTATISLDRCCSEPLSMRVESVGSPAEDGTCLVIYSCDRAMREIISSRVLSGELIYGSISGIRVPKKAVKLDDDGKTCVYTLTGAQAELKHITILEEVGDYYIVQNDTSNVSALREADEIIVSAKNLYDGKVVK